MRVLYPGIRGSGVEVYTERLVAGLAPLGWKGQLLRFSPAWEYFPWGSEICVEQGAPDKGVRPRPRQRRLRMLFFSCGQTPGGDAAPQFD